MSTTEERRLLRQTVAALVDKHASPEAVRRAIDSPRGYDEQLWAMLCEQVGVAALVALCSALLKKSVRGGLIIVGEINLGGSIEPIHNPVTIAEIAVEKGAGALLIPVGCRRRLFDLSDEMATKVDIQFYRDAKDALLKGMLE